MNKRNLSTGYVIANLLVLLAGAIGIVMVCEGVANKLHLGKIAVTIISVFVFGLIVVAAPIYFVTRDRDLRRKLKNVRRKRGDWKS